MTTTLKTGPQALAKKKKTGAKAVPIPAVQAQYDRVLKIRAGKDPAVRPGQAARFTEASTPGDCLDQGDLRVIIIPEPERKGYKKVQRCEWLAQLVPGNTQGSKHVIRDLGTVGEMWLPGGNWTEDGLRGPQFLAKKETVIDHPTHGAVTVPAGFWVICIYQQLLDAVTKRKRRAAD